MPKSINALGMMKRVKALIEKASPSIEHYEEVLNDKNILRVHPDLDKYYRTFDGSVVLVTNKRKTRPNENMGVVIRHDNAESLGESLGEIVEELVGHTVGGEDDDNEEDREQFLCTVIHGGHGVTSMPGDLPGSSYIVNDEGLTIFAAPSEEKCDLNFSVNLGYLSVVGLCLREQVNATFEGSK